MTEDKRTEILQRFGDLPPDLIGLVAMKFLSEDEQDKATQDDYLYGATLEAVEKGDRVEQLAHEVRYAEHLAKLIR